MDYFLDTNVEIGYVFCTDPWNERAVSLFDKNNILHYSYCVDKEFNIKFNSILKEQKNFLFSLRDDLNIGNTSKALSLKDLKIKSTLIHLKRDFDDNKKERIIEVLWKYSRTKHIYDTGLKSHVCSVKDLSIYIGKFIREFERKISVRRLYFENQVIFHPKRDEEYKELNEKLLFEGGVHFPDNFIILDAHDLSLNENIVLDFITADSKMIEKAIVFLDFLNINNFRQLKDFC